MMGGACNTQAKAMFDTVESLSKSKLVALKTGSSVYAALLETPHGQLFEANVGGSALFKQDAALLASVIALDQSEDADDAVGGSSGTTHGFESCLPTDIDPSLNAKFGVLNCLQMEKPHSLWVALHGDQSKQDALKRDLDRYSWLQYDNFACSNGIIPDPGSGLPCLKHDIPYASLQVFIADNVGTPGDTLDAAWNPRNKHLADHLFVIDGICEMKVGKQRRECIPEAAADHGILETLLHVEWWIPKLNHHGVSRINDKNWPFTEHDVKHAVSLPWYIQCDYPSVTHNIGVSKEDWTFTAKWSSWSLEQGCVEDIV